MGVFRLGCRVSEAVNFAANFEKFKTVESQLSGIRQGSGEEAIRGSLRSSKLNFSENIENRVVKAFNKDGFNKAKEMLNEIKEEAKGILSKKLESKSDEEKVLRDIRNLADSDPEKALNAIKFQFGNEAGKVDYDSLSNEFKKIYNEALKNLAKSSPKWAYDRMCNDFGEGSNRVNYDSLSDKLKEIYNEALRNLAKSDPENVMGIIQSQMRKEEYKEWPLELRSIFGSALIQLIKLDLSGSMFDYGLCDIKSGLDKIGSRMSGKEYEDWSPELQSFYESMLMQESELNTDVVGGIEFQITGDSDYVMDEIEYQMRGKEYKDWSPKLQSIYEKALRQQSIKDPKSVIHRIEDLKVEYKVPAKLENIYYEARVRVRWSGV